MTRGTVRALSVAPMMERTDRHFRWFVRQITRHTLLYTEMVAARAVLHGDREHLLGYDPAERPLALQLGGDDPARLAECARIAEDWGYDEVNLNVGCPSSRVQEARFGAVLMRTPEVVAACVAAMRSAATIPVTVKHRIGVDELDRYEDMERFVRVVADAGADRFTVHARKAWLHGLSPKENRTVPPLRYEDVFRLKRTLPELGIELNGGVKTLDAAVGHLVHVDAVMIGRAAYDDPWQLAEADRRVFGGTEPAPLRADVVAAVQGYAARWEGRPGHRAHHITTHVNHLFSGLRGARAWRRALGEGVRAGLSGSEVLGGALEAVHAAQA